MPPVRVLVTTSRMPFALGLIRRLGEAGHDVLATDTYATAPGSHSRFVEEHVITPVPATEPEAFAAEVERIAREREVDVVVPTWEDAFFLSLKRDSLSAVARPFFSPFETLARLHDKYSFAQLAVSLGVNTPETVLARTHEELSEALGRFNRYFARAVYSRGGVTLLTNTGPLAGHLSLDDVEPTEANPWLVQDFVDGPMVCTYSTVHAGRVTAHCAYRAPRQWEHSTGIEFLSIEPEESLGIVEKIVGELGYTGQVSFDFVESPDGLAIIECNPRTTDGVLLMSSEEAAGGMLYPARELSLVEAGRRIELNFAMFAELFNEPLRETPRTWHDLLHVRGANTGWRDALPSLYSFLAFAHHERLNLREREPLLEAMSKDVCWNGEPIAGMSEADCAFLAGLGRG